MSEKSNNIFSILNRTSKSFNRVFITLGILSLGALFVSQTVNKNLTNENDLIKNEVDATFDCKTTAPNDVQKLDKTDLKTIKQIGQINFENEIFHSDYSKNQIPAIFIPKFSSYSDLDNCINPTEEVIIVTIDSKTKVYPKRILQQNLLVNDSIMGNPILISYSNLSGSYRVFDRTIKNEELFFGVSGEVYKNNDLIFDSKTESLWSQFDGLARIGTFTNAKLQLIDFQISSWKFAKETYPDAQVLNFDTGSNMSYQIIDYGDFSKHDKIITSLINADYNLKLKEKVYGFKIAENYYAIRDIKVSLNAENTYKADGKIVKIIKTEDTITISVDSVPVKYQNSYWYVWYDFYPSTKVLN